MKNINLTQKNAKLLLCMFGAIIISVTGCKKENNPAPKQQQTTVTGPYLYVGGSASLKGVYYKVSLSQAGAKFTTDTLANAGERINSIITYGQDVYMTGQAGGYWKNNSFVPVTGASSVFYLTLSGNNVYTTGFDNTGNMAYWINNTETNLQNTVGRNIFPYQGVSSYSLSGIAVSGTNALVTGSLSFENEPFSPDTARSGNFGLLWNNGGVQLFGQGVLLSAVLRETVGVAVAGSDVYVAGIKPDVTYAGGYWKNGAWNSINNGVFNALAITTNGSDVYIAGSIPGSTGSSYQGVYWKNGTIVNIGNAGSVTAIAVNGTDVYALGVDHNLNNVVWKNGAVFATLGTLNSQTVTCMAIGN